jgi:Fe-S-cluster-containing hydrogenase component 2
MLVVDIAKCTGCRRCECACAFFRTGKISNRLARIKVVSLYEIGIDGPVACVQCQERYCTHCPSGAITIGSFGQIVVSPTICTCCGACQKACPVGAIEIVGEFVYVCDLCGGRPKCVEACTEGAIIDKRDDACGPSLAAVKQGTKDLSPTEKRARYAETLGGGLRLEWRKAHA